MKKPRIEEIRGCLADLKTADELAWRRHPDDADEDLLGPRPFAVDGDNKISTSRGLRRSGHKTQVITDPSNLHIRTRRSHIDDVVNIATQIGGILGLNVDLCRAIALGHDIGHAPLGHSGEKFISDISGKKFNHATFGVVLAQKIERGGYGLNLTHQVLAGILHHSTGLAKPKANDLFLPEENVVIFADKIAYLTCDYNDIIMRTGLKPSDALRQAMEGLGTNQRLRAQSLILGLCVESAKEGKISFRNCAEAETLFIIKKEMSELYPLFNIQEGAKIMEKIYNFIKRVIKYADPAIVLALMTDDDVLNLHSISTLCLTDLMKTSAWELIPSLENKEIDITDPDLDW